MRISQRGRANAPRITSHGLPRALDECALMKRQLVISAPELRKTIKHVMAPEAGRRVAVAAFIGRDALEFIPEPDGIEVYCWDQPSVTDPEGVADLMQGGTVWFVTGLHMKIYWSQHHGVLIGSPNLSNNALGESATLLESAIYYDDSSAVSISKVESILRVKRRPAEDWIDDLRRRSNLDVVARRGAKNKTRSVDDYFTLANPAPWRIAIWGGISGEHSVADYKAVVGVGGIQDIAEARERLSRSSPAPRGTKKGDWLLQVAWRQGGRPSVTRHKWHGIYLSCA